MVENTAVMAACIDRVAKAADITFDREGPADTMVPDWHVTEDIGVALSVEDTAEKDTGLDEKSMNINY